MKIAILCPYNKAMFRKYGEPTGGIETMVESSIEILSMSNEHEVHVIFVGPLDVQYVHMNKNAHFAQATNLYRDIWTESSSEWAQMIRRIYMDTIFRINPDVVISAMHSHGIAATLSEDFPVVAQNHVFMGMPTFYEGAIKINQRIINNGGRVYSTEPAAETSLKNWNDYLQRSIQMPEVFTDFAKTFLSLESVFKDQEILESTGGPLMAGRYDEDFTGKRMHMFDKAGIPIVSYVIGEHARFIKQMQDSVICELHLNEPRDNIVESLRRTPCVIMGWPEETAGLVAIEGLVFGASPIYMTHKRGDMHGFKDLLSDISPHVKPISIAYEDDDWVDQVNAKVKEFSSIPMNIRTQIAMNSRKRLSDKAWLDEYVSVANSAKCRKNSEMDIF